MHNYLIYKGFNVFSALYCFVHFVSLPVKISAEMKAYQPIPIIADFTNEDGSDNLKETIEANYKRVKQEIISLVESEKERIRADPALAHLSKE